MPQSRIGGAFAPPLTDELLAKYRTTIDDMPAGPIKDALDSLLPCCEEWWDLPEPNGTKTKPHPVGVGTIVSLQDDHKHVLDEHIPWEHELKAIQDLFDALPTGVTPPGQEQFVYGVRRAVVIDPAAKALRDMAFHLLWHVRELDFGREPLTADKL